MLSIRGVGRNGERFFRGDGVRPALLIPVSMEISGRRVCLKKTGVRPDPLMVYDDDLEVNNILPLLEI